MVDRSKPWLRFQISRRWFTFGLVLIAISGLFALYRSTPYGLGLTNDSASYVNGAVNLLSGNGYTRTSGGGELKPLTHFPPLMSFSLALLGLFFGNTVPAMLSTGRGLIVFLFGLDAFLVGLLLIRITRSPVFSWLGALVFAFSDILLGVYSYYLSEPLFITLFLAGFLALAIFFEKRTWPGLVAAGLVCGLAYLARYVGLSLVASILLVFFLLDVRWGGAADSPPGRPPSSPGLFTVPIRSFFPEVTLFGAGALLPVIVWSLVSLASSGTVANRLVVWHPISPAELFEALKNLLAWLAPDDLLAAQPFWGRLLSALSLAVLPVLAVFSLWVLLRQVRARKTGSAISPALSTAFALAVHVWVYIVFLILSISLIDASTPLDARILSVAFIPLMILVISAIAWLWERLKQGISWRKSGARAGLALLALALAVVSVKDGLRVVNQLGHQGQGFAYQGIVESSVIQSIQKMPPVIIYTNKPAVVYLLTGRPAYVTPTPVDAATTQARTGFDADFNTLRASLLSGKSVLVLFDLARAKDPNEIAFNLKMSAGLVCMTDSGFAQIYTLAGSQPDLQK
ncbi:MAG TPA: hypothetical protein VMT46_05875 [Anaerolineaceae bacterium]|nr:hypothetical protein [Anaerolineaceae bacterium]